MFISIFMKLLQTMAPRNAMEAEEQPSRGTTEVLDSVEPIKQPTLRIVWRNVILMALLHFGAIYALTLIPKSHPLTWLWCKRMVLIHTLNNLISCQIAFKRLCYYSTSLPVKVMNLP